MTKNPHQILIDTMFSIAMLMQSGRAKFTTQTECAEWVARQLRLVGFNTEPVGVSWGVLKR